MTAHPHRTLRTAAAGATARQQRRAEATFRPAGFSIRRSRIGGLTLLAWLAPPLCIPCLIWPALWNGYPIVFADTGTYLSQAMHRYLGWDRPVFYSLSIWPLHLGLTTWPVVLAQSAVTVMVLDLVRRGFGLSRAWLLAVTVFLAVATSLPWLVSELLPDLFTPLLVMLLGLLVFAPSRFRPSERVTIILLAAFMIATQQSSVPLTLGLLFAVMPVRWLAAQYRSEPTLSYHLAPWPGILAPVLAPALAIAGLIAVNAAGFDRVSISPYGNVFVLARVIYDGPGMTVLRRDCPESGWRLCPWLDRFPATSDEFLWADAGPIVLAGGHKAISADADAIINAAIRTEPGRLLAASWNNTIEQLTRFASGDGIQDRQTQTESRIDRDFPASERARFHAARQQAGTLSVPAPLATAHRIVALTGVAAALALLPIAWRRRHVAAWFLIVSLLTLPLSAAITGGLSTPHDRYQSRVVWLPACMAFLSVPALARRSRHNTA